MPDRADIIKQAKRAVDDEIKAKKVRQADKIEDQRHEDEGVKLAIAMAMNEKLVVTLEDMSADFKDTVSKIQVKAPNVNVPDVIVPKIEVPDIKVVVPKIDTPIIPEIKLPARDMVATNKILRSILDKKEETIDISVKLKIT